MCKKKSQSCKILYCALFAVEGKDFEPFTIPVYFESSSDSSKLLFFICMRA